MFEVHAYALYHASPPSNRVSILKNGLRANKEGEVCVSPGLGYYFSDIGAWDVWEVNPQGYK